MKFSTTFASLALLGLPLLTSAYNTDKYAVLNPQPHKVIHVNTQDDMDGMKSLTHGQRKTERFVYYVSNGYAIMDGDIMVGKEKDILKHRKNKPGSRKGKKNSKHHPRDFDMIGHDEDFILIDKRALSIFAEWKEQRWPGAVLTYKFQDEDTEKVLKAAVGEAIAHWLAASPFLKFVQLPSKDAYTKGTLLIQKTEGAPACWSSIGWCKDCDLSMQLDLACTVSTYVHEFGHALGLHHEHQRPDRDDYMSFNCSALSDYHIYGTDQSSCPGAPEKCCASQTCFGWACSFAHITHLDYHGPLDLKSVMMYQEYSFSAGLYPTISGINGNKVPSLEHPDPSEGDKTRICEIYHEQCDSGGVDPTNPQVCGNGKLEGTEECDDGNTIDGDGCSSKCTKEHIDGGQKCETCNPSPLENKCDITTSCITTHPGGSTMCACRDGYKANAGYDAATLAEWRLPFQGQETRVFVKPGIICNQLCDNWANGGNNGVLCGEVQTKKNC